MVFRKRYYSKSHEIKPKKLPEFYNVFHVTFCAAIGSIAAGAVLMYMNYRNLRHPKNGIINIILCVFISFLFICVAKINTDRSLLILYMIPHGGCMYFIYQFIMRNLYYENIDHTVIRAGWQKPFFVSFIGLISNLLTFMVVPEALCRKIITYIVTNFDNFIDFIW